MGEGAEEEVNGGKFRKRTLMKKIFLSLAVSSFKETFKAFSPEDQPMASYEMCL